MKPQPTSRRFSTLGPGGGGGQLRPAIHPKDPRILFITCDMTGWYQTTDAGESWRNINLKGVVRCSAFDPSRRKVVYAGNAGLYRSEDLGRTWRLIFPAAGQVVEEIQAHDHADQRYVSRDNWPGGTILGIAVDPADSRRIHLAIYRQGPSSGELLIYASTDYAASFRQVAAIADIPSAGAIGDNHAVKFLHLDAKSPKDDRQLYLASPCGVYRVAAAGGRVERMPLPPGVERIDYACAGQAAGKPPVLYITAPASWRDRRTLTGGGFRSDDLGRSWRQIHAGLLDGLHEPGAGRPPQFTCVACCATRPERVYLECRSHPERSDEEALYGQPFGVFRSDDGGGRWAWCFRTAWDERPSGTIDDAWLTRWNGPGAIGAAIQLGVAPSDPDVVWRVTAMCSHCTDNGGRAWRETYARTRPDGATTTNGMDVTTCYGVHFDPHAPKRVFISYTDIGLFGSQDGGRGWWISRGGVPLAWRNTCYWMAFDPDVRDRMWSVWSGCHDLPRPKMFPGDWSRRAGGVAVSGDGGRSWHPNTAGMPDSAVPTHILLDPRSPAGMRTLYVASFNQGVYRSDNDARSWQRKNVGLDAANLYAWRLALAKDGRLFLCVARGGPEDGPYVDGAIYASDDRAESWEKLPLPAGVNAPNDLAVDPRNPRRLYLACWPRTVDGRPIGGGVWGSVDGGRSWRSLLDDRLHCYSVTIDEAEPSRLFATGFNGAIFRSDDAGRRWRRLGGYNFKWGHRVIIDPRDRRRIYVTTFGGSVFVGPSDGTGQEFEDIVP